MKIDEATLAEGERLQRVVSESILGSRKNLAAQDALSNFLAQHGHAYIATARDAARYREALSALLCMLPSDHPERPANERIPASYCYVRWQEIREGRAAIDAARAAHMDGGDAAQMEKKK